VALPEVRAGLEPAGKWRSRLILAIMAVLIIGGIVIWVVIQRNAAAISGSSVP
jgi:hypothetical protein